MQDAADADDDDDDTDDELWELFNDVPKPDQEMEEATNADDDEMWEFFQRRPEAKAYIWSGSAA